MDTIENIKFVLNKIRPYIISDGGDVEFVKFDIVVREFEELDLYFNEKLILFS